MANTHQVCVNTCQAGFHDFYVAAKVVIREELKPVL